MIKLFKGMLVEYALSLPPLILEFEFNPETLTRSRSVSVNAENAWQDFKTIADTRHVTQGVTASAETISFKLLLDASDKLAERNPIAIVSGIEPELSTLRNMLEPKVDGPDAFQMMADLGLGSSHAHDRDEHLSVLLFVWGTHILPVFITGMNIDEKAHLPTLKPYRAEVTLSLQVIESANPFYKAEQVQRVVMSSLNQINQILPF